MDALHEVHNPAKAIVLAARIKRHGWRGVPLVVDGEQLLTGTHRYAACGLIGWQDDEIPTIEVRELFAAQGLDFDAIYAEEDRGDYYQALVWTIEALPADVRAEYGLDMH